MSTCVGICVLLCVTLILHNKKQWCGLQGISWFMYANICNNSMLGIFQGLLDTNYGAVTAWIAWRLDLLLYIPLFIHFCFLRFWKCMKNNSCSCDLEQDVFFGCFMFGVCLRDKMQNYLRQLCFVPAFHSCVSRDSVTCETVLCWLV